MALSNYTELQAAIRTETSVTTGGLADAVIVDAINRAEAKINRRARCREMEQLAYATYSTGTAALADRRIALPTGFLEFIALKVRKASESDDKYVEVPYEASMTLWERYTSSSSQDKLRFTIRKQIEFSKPVSEDHRVMMHYLKRWDIASNATNWLLTNFPDIYLYGALMECEAHLKNDSRIVVWKALFDEGIRELNLLDERSRDDATLDTSEVAQMSGRRGYNILTGSN